MESEREHEEGQDEPLADRKLGDLGNTDAKTVIPKDDEPSDDEADAPPDQRT